MPSSLSHLFRRRPRGFRRKVMKKYAEEEAAAQQQAAQATGHAVPSTSSGGAGAEVGMPHMPDRVMYHHSHHVHQPYHLPAHRTPNSNESPPPLVNTRTNFKLKSVSGKFSCKLIIKKKILPLA